MSEPEFGKATFEYKKSEKRENESEFQNATFDYKPSDNSGNNSYKRYSPPERGGCLTAFLAFICIAQVLVILGSLVLLDRAGISSNSIRQSGGFATILQIVVSIVAISCAIGLYNWQKWGYYGLLGLYALVIIISFLGGALPNVGAAFIAIFILFFLMREKTRYLD